MICCCRLKWTFCYLIEIWYKFLLDSTNQSTFPHFHNPKNWEIYWMIVFFTNFQIYPTSKAFFSLNFGPIPRVTDVLNKILGIFIKGQMPLATTLNPSSLEKTASCLFVLQIVFQQALALLTRINLASYCSYDCWKNSLESIFIYHFFL